MQLGALIDRAERLERRAAALYRTYASATDPPAAAVFSRLAAEETDHATSLHVARTGLSPTAAWRTHAEGWREVLADVDRRLAAAEALPATTPLAQRLSAALELELSELDHMRAALLAITGHPFTDEGRHGLWLAEQATRLCDDPQVGLQAALLRARAALR